ncbi:MAG: hypothetical protein WDO19_16110 [Bacteroidota bacterium]
MPAITLKNRVSTNVTEVKEMRDYSKEPVFKKKTDDVAAFLRKQGLPKAFKKKNK